MALFYKGLRTVCVSDVAQPILNCAKDPDIAGQVYQAVGPKCYMLNELVFWFHRIMTDNVLSNVPTLEDLGVQLTHMEEQVLWELRSFRTALNYDANLKEF